jgi:hypothetical protein
MAKYLIRALRQLRVGDGLRQPGELLPEAIDWPNLRHYENLRWLEKVAVPEDFEGKGAIEYPPPAPQSRLSEILNPERAALEMVVAGKRKGKTTQEIRCVNCRKKNHVPVNFKELALFLCWDCNQQQSLAQARDHPAPTSFEEWLDSRNARSEDLTAAWSPAAAAAKQEEP